MNFRNWAIPSIIIKLMNKDREGIYKRRIDRNQFYPKKEREKEEYPPSP